MNSFFGIISKESNVTHKRFDEFLKEFHNELEPVLNFFWDAKEYSFESNRFFILLDGEISIDRNPQLNNESRQQIDLSYLSECLGREGIMNVLERSNGNFSIIIYDRLEQNIFLTRDVFGFKPLFYGLDGKRFSFSTHFDRIFSHPSFPNPTLRPEIMKEFLALGYMHAPNTIFKNIYQVEPGQIVKYDLITNQIKKEYYFHWKPNPTVKEGLSESIQTTKTILQNRIGHCLNQNDFSTLLSGGIDSALVTAYASKRSSKKIRSFTFKSRNGNYDESEIAKEYAGYFNTEQIIFQIDEGNLVNLIEEHFESLSEPLGDYSSIPSYFIAKEARRHTDYVLSGDGGDELFWGYPRFIKSAQQAKWFLLPFKIRKVMIPIMRKINPKLSNALDVEKRFGDWILHQQMHFKINQLMPEISFSQELLNIYKYDGDFSKTSILQFLKENEIQGHLQRVLKKVEMTSRKNDLTIISPFLDKELLLFSNTIIPQLHKHNNPKIILKDLLEAETDDRLVNLPKRGFGVPIEDWLRNELSADVKKHLLEKSFYGEEFIHVKKIHQLVLDFFDNKKSINAWGLWHLYVWQKWVYKYSDLLQKD